MNISRFATPFPMSALALIAVCGLSLDAPALAQNALGDGRAHDANFQQGGSRYNPPGRNANIAQEVRFRNAIVTGNAPGGLSFRGDAGYLASDDFRAQVGSDSLYDFQRDSLYSGLATRGIRNIDALRAQMSLATGGAPTYDTGGLFIDRAAAGATAGGLSANQPQISIDPFTTRIGSMRSTASYIGGQSIEPQYFGSTRDQNGQTYAIGSSPLRGVIAQPLLVNPDAPLSPLPQLPGNATTPGSTAPSAQNQTGANQANAPAPSSGLTFNPADTTSDDESLTTPRPGQVNQSPTTNKISDSIDPESLAPNNLSNRVTPRSPYDSIIAEFMAAPPAPSNDDTPDNQQAAPPTTPARQSFLDSVEDLRRQILGLPARDAESDNDDASTAAPLEVIDPQTGEVIKPPAPSEALRSMREQAARTFGEAAVPTLDSLVPTGADATLYNKYMRDGEAQLKAARWFDAEETFTRAINRRNGDPIASAGRISAQLGAGMYLSASVNLRALFAAHPEMAAVKFREGLFLSGDRLQQVQIYLRDESNKERAFARDAALLLAYIGYQTGDTRAVKNAFDAYTRNATDLAAAPDPLAEMLQGAWIDAPERREDKR